MLIHNTTSQLLDAQSDARTHTHTHLHVYMCNIYTAHEVNSCLIRQPFMDKKFLKLQILAWCDVGHFSQAFRAPLRYGMSPWQAVCWAQVAVAHFLKLSAWFFLQIVLVLTSSVGNPVELVIR